MTTQLALGFSLAALVSFSSFTSVASGQPGAAGSAASVQPAPVAQPAPVQPAPVAQPAPVQPAPVAQPAPATAPAPQQGAPVAVVPPGYALVPVEGGEAQTKYNVEYPQAHGALPPGMELPYEEGDPVPPGYRVVTQPRRGLVIAGSIVTGVLWGLSVTAAVGDDFDNKSGSLLLPVLGPWLMLALGGAKDRPCNYEYSYSDCGNQSGLRSMLVLDGLGQLAGATMFTLGFALPKTRLVRKDVTLSMAPMPVGNFGYGFGAVGQF